MITPSASFVDEAAARCVRPNLFDAYADSHLILPIVLANLASPRLWTLAEKLKARVANFPDDGDPHGVSPFIRAAAKQIDRDFEHLRPEDVAELIGIFDLSTERARLGTDIVDTAVHSIIESCRYRMERGTLKADALLKIIEAGQFPAYCYTNIDVIRAHRRLLHKRAHPPAGLTSCVDEAAMFAALTMTMPENTIFDCVMLSSPTHSTAFGRDGIGRPFWFFGKNLIFSKADWDARVAETYAGDTQQAFDDLLPQTDRILSIEGVFDFRSGASEITPDNISSMINGLRHFFGTLPRQIQEAIDKTIHYAPPSGFAAIFRRFLPTDNHKAFADFLHQHETIDDSETDLVAAAFRTLRGCAPRVFVKAARQALLRHFDLSSIDAALAQIRALPLNQSIFDDQTRITMPDETLLFGGGSSHDKALLLHIALERITGDTVVTLITADDAFVQMGHKTWSATTGVECSAPADAIILVRLAD